MWVIEGGGRRQKRLPALEETTGAQALEGPAQQPRRRAPRGRTAVRDTGSRTHGEGSEGSQLGGLHPRSPRVGTWPALSPGAASHGAYVQQRPTFSSKSGSSNFLPPGLGLAAHASSPGWPPPHVPGHTMLLSASYPLGRFWPQGPCPGCPTARMARLTAASPARPLSSAGSSPGQPPRPRPGAGALPFTQTAGTPPAQHTCDRW